MNVENVVFIKDNEENTYPIRDNRLDNLKSYNIEYDHNDTISITEVKIDE